MALYIFWSNTTHKKSFHILFSIPEFDVEEDPIFVEKLCIMKIFKIFSKRLQEIK